MTEHNLECRAFELVHPGPLRPEARPGFPIWTPEAGAFSTIAITGRRVVAHLTASHGLVSASIDGDAPAAAPTMGLTPSPRRTPDRVEVGHDRLYRAWTDQGDVFEELLIVPLGQPFVARRWKHTDGEGAEWWGRGNAPSDAQRRLIEQWRPIDRSWNRELISCARVRGPDDLSERWDRGCASLVSAVRTGPDRSGARPSVDPERTTTAAVVRLALGLCATGRADLAVDLVRRIGDLKARSHVQRWVNRWMGSPGDQPDEESSLIPEWLGSEPALSLLGPAGAGDFCARFIDLELGIRPDQHFGRVRFGPSPAMLRRWGSAVDLDELALGHGRTSTRASFGWSVDEHADGEATHTLRVSADAGSVPLQVVFEPLMPTARIRAVSLDGDPVEPQVDAVNADSVRIRLQCPLDRERTLRVQLRRR